MSAYLTSDLHLGHKNVAIKRGFSSVEEHDSHIIEGLSGLGKRDKLFILGDVAHRLKDLIKLSSLKCTMDLVAGNHDQLRATAYASIFNKVYGLIKYKNFWLSHCPIHPQEMYRCVGNIHGHIHMNTDSELLSLPYFNVNVELHDYKPVPFLSIVEKFE